MSRGRFTCRVCGSDFYDYCVNLVCPIGWNIAESRGENPEDDPEPEPIPRIPAITVEREPPSIVICEDGRVMDADLGAFLPDTPRNREIVDGLADHYILRASDVVGNCAVWWRPNSQGYTCDLAGAGLYTLAEARKYQAARADNVPVHKDVAELFVVRHVRLEHLRQHGLLVEYDRRRSDDR